ncbi:MAG: hypothetical protein KAT32_03155 [Candidatus Moranbacteria bacterium]|nr:hypothetical protein [Candidatus Moranbacteria bacterium]
MNNPPQTDYTFFRTLTIMLLTFLWTAFLLTLMSIFYTSALWTIWLTINIFLFYKKILPFPKPSRELKLYILIALIFSSLIATFTEPTIFAGRDQGSIAEASLRLEKNHTLIFQTPATETFFEIYKTEDAQFYGQGEALNFPGFHYLADGSLITQFPLPYISFLAGFTGIFKLNGFIVANFILTFFFVLALGILVRYLLTHEYAVIFLILLTTSFSISFFAKFTLSENLAGTLIWISAVLFLRVKDHVSNKNYFAFFLTISILPFIRIEGIWFFAIFLFMFFKNKERRQFITEQTIWHKLIMPLSILFCIGIASFIMSTPFYVTMVKVFLKAIDPILTKIGITELNDNLINQKSKSSTSNFNFLLNVYTIYGLFFPLILTSLMSFKAALNKKYRFLLLPIGITLPLFIYYANPQISLDHPWLLRRFSFALIPATLIVSVIFIATIHKTKFLFTKYILIFLLLITNLSSTVIFFTYRENIGLQEQVHEFAKQFNENDLILIDENATGSNWSMITTPLNLLENKNAVYFFNPEDFAKLNTEKFDRVFLVTSDENEKRYRDVLQFQMLYYNDYTFTTNQLKIAERKIIPVILPENENLIITGKIYELKK